VILLLRYTASKAKDDQLIKESNMKILTVVSITALILSLATTSLNANPSIAKSKIKESSIKSTDVKQAKLTKNLKAVKADTKINLNSAGAEEIAASLTGIGIKKAVAIVEYRKQHGEFKSLEELTLVKGIGDKTLAKNHQRILLK
jgi:competence protein ComEA